MVPKHVPHLATVYILNEAVCNMRCSRRLHHDTIFTADSSPWFGPVRIVVEINRHKTGRNGWQAAPHDESLAAVARPALELLASLEETMLEHLRLQPPVGAALVQRVLVSLLATELLLALLLGPVVRLHEQRAEGDDAGDYEGHAELAVEPEPGECHALFFTDPSSGLGAVYVVEDTTSQDCDGDGEEDEAEDEGKNDLLPNAEPSPPKNEDGEADDWKNGLVSRNSSNRTSSFSCKDDKSRVTY